MRFFGEAEKKTMRLFGEAEKNYEVLQPPEKKYGVFKSKFLMIFGLET